MKKELKKCGFTLIELLAVIVVLAVIALITTPIILNVMDKAKKGALEDSAYGLLESANIYYAEGTLENNVSKTEFTFKDGVQTSENKLSYKGKIENGSVKLYSDGKSALCITGGNYAALKNVNDKKVSVVKGRCSYNTETEEYETNGLCKDLQEELDGIKGLGDATSEDILKGKTAVVKGKLVTGTVDTNTTFEALIPQMTSNSMDGYVASASKNYNDSNPYYAFDRIDTGYVWSIGTGVSNGHWLQIEMPKEKTAILFVVRPYYGSNQLYLKSFLLQGSNDGATWVNLVDNTETLLNGENVFSIENPKSYRFYRIYGRSTDFDGMAIYSMQLYGY